jgi:hypothetical protein
MSVFQTQFALIDEAWGQPMFAPSIVNKHKSQGPVEKDSSEPGDVAARRILNETYRVGGIGAVKKVLDPAIVRDIQAEVVRKQSSSASMFPYDLTKEDWVYVLLGLFTLMFVIDSR